MFLYKLEETLSFSKLSQGQFTVQSLAPEMALPPVLAHFWVWAISIEYLINRSRHILFTVVRHILIYCNRALILDVDTL